MLRSRAWLWAEHAIPAPTIVSVAPAMGPDAGGTALTIVGTGFLAGVSVVRLAQLITTPTNVDSIVVVDDSHITCMTRAFDPFGPRTLNLFVRTPYGGAELGAAFTYGSTANVVAIASNLGDTLGGDHVVIQVNDSTGATGATVGGVALSGFTIDDATHVSGTTGAHAAGAVDVIVTSGGGASSPLVGAYEYWSPLQIPGLTLFLDTPGYAIAGGIATWTARAGGNATNGAPATFPTNDAGAPQFIRANTQRLTCAQVIGQIIGLSHAIPSELAMVIGVDSLPAAGGYDFITSDFNSLRQAFEIDSTGLLYYLLSDGGYPSCSIPGVGVGRHTFVGRRSPAGGSSNTSLTLDGTTFGATVAVGDILSDAGYIGIGRNATYPAYSLDAHVKVIVASQGTAWTAATYAKFFKWSSVRHPAPALPLSADFSALPLGKNTAASIAASTGLLFSRASVSTVQTSASSIDSTPGVDDGCIGNAGFGPGLVLQPNTFNLLGGAPDNNSPRDLTVSWSGGTMATTPAFAAGPDGVAPGVGCSRTGGGATTYSNYGNVPASVHRTFSSWQRSKDVALNGSMQMGWIAAAPGDGIQATRAASNTWGRLALVNGGTFRQYFAVSDCRDYSGSGGDTPRARDVLVDYIQLEAGNYPTEAIAHGQARRANDHLSYPAAADLISSGQLRFYAKFIPRFASTDDVYYDGSGGGGISPKLYFLTWNGAAGYIAIDRSTNAVVMHSNGDALAGSVAMAWAAGEVIEVYTELGGGIASKFFYRKNGGAWLDVSPTTNSLANIAPIGAMRIFAYDQNDTADAGVIPCWLQKVTFGGARPA